MELQDYLRALRKRWRVIVACVLLGVIAAGTASLLSTPMYKAETQLFVSPKSGDTSQELLQGNSFIQTRVKSYVHVIDSEIVLQPVIDKLGLNTTVQALAGQVEATVPTDTVLLAITVTSTSANQAADIANAVATQFTAVAAQLEPAKADLTSVVTITVVEPAVVPSAAFSPDTKLYVAAGALFGLAIGIALAVARELLDKRIRRDSDLRAVTDLPLMGRIPADKDAVSHPLVIGTAAKSIRAEAFRQVRTNLQFLDVPSGHRSFVITSSLPDEGKSTLALNLALTHAEAGLSVCLVDADLRRPSIGEYLGLESSIGLTDILIGSVPTEVATQTWGPTTLDVIPAGRIPPNPSDLLAGEAMRSLLANLQRLYDVVIIDSPPLLPVTDAAILAKRCAGAIVVIGCGPKAVNRAQLARSLNSLDSVDARVLGLVMNRVPTKGPDALLMSEYSYESFDDSGRSARHSLVRNEPDLAPVVEGPDAQSGDPLEQGADNPSQQTTDDGKTLPEPLKEQKPRRGLRHPGVPPAPANSRP